MELGDIKGIGPSRIEKLRAVGISSLRDLLCAFPVRYEDHDTVMPCASRAEGMIQIRGRIDKGPVLQRFHGLTKVSCTVRDESGSMAVQWFNSPWMMNTLRGEAAIRLYGRVIIKDGRRYLQNPKIVTDAGWIPVYRNMTGFPQKSYRKLVETALENSLDVWPEILPASYRERHGLMEAGAAIRAVHFPGSLEELNAAKRRISYEQMLMYLAYVAKRAGETKPAAPISVREDSIEAYWRLLSFRPTGAQRKVLEEIASDLRKNQAMKRLVQGDVGCGKTAVAFGAIWLCREAGFQSAMMAPTEILAEQHYAEAERILGSAGVRCRLLTGSTRAKERKMILEELSDGSCEVLFGTQALISEGVQYSRLGLVITDEQHRFGVNQRTNLQRKGETETRFPHVLVMSATPIPRSMALILYGDLDLSLVDEMPAGRIPVQTRIVKEERREDLYRYLEKEIRDGRQAYIVCPKVDDDPPEEGAEETGEGARHPEEEDTNAVRSAMSVWHELLERRFPENAVGLTWGAQKSEEKTETLEAFKQGRIRVLVATTVVEVGVNNPNATIMIVENAERFGLSQLHQLRGRVGRGTEKSWCFLVSDKEEKLRILRETNDGFLVSQKDLEIRGPGEIVGTRQSGHVEEGGAAMGDIRMLDEVSESVKELRRSREPEDQTTLRRIEEKAEQLFSIQEIGIN